MHVCTAIFSIAWYISYEMSSVPEHITIDAFKEINPHMENDIKTS